MNQARGQCGSDLGYQYTLQLRTAALRIKSNYNHVRHMPTAATAYMDQLHVVCALCLELMTYIHTTASICMHQDLNIVCAALQHQCLSQSTSLRDAPFHHIGKCWWSSYGRTLIS
jgi:hypothetical protein